MNRRSSLLLALFLCSGVTASAQSKPAPLAGEGHKRVALVIGNNAYANANPLVNPVNDARAMEATLRKDGFEVILEVNAGMENMGKALNRFIGKLSPGDVALFYFSGHGMQIAGENYLLPVDFTFTDEAGAQYHSLALNEVLARMEGSRADLRMVILDACRNNPFGGARGGSRGLALVAAQSSGTIIFYSTSPGKTADDNREGQNGLYTGNLLKALQEPGLTLDEIYKRTARAVKTASGGQQEPAMVSSVVNDFYFVPSAPSPGVASTTPAKPESKLVPPLPAPPLKDKWALVVGIGKFADPKIPRLILATKDAMDFASLLKDPQIGRFPADHVRVLLDEQATTRNIRLHLNWLARSASPDDLVVLYFASHGSPRERDTAGNSYFITQDTEVSSADDLFATALPFVDFGAFMQTRLRAKRAVFFLDASHSGRISIGDAMLSVNEPLEGLPEQGRVFISSCQTRENSFDSPAFQNSYFAYYLLRALRSSHGMISVGDLYREVRRQVTERVLQDVKARQTPVLNMSGDTVRVVLGQPIQ